MGCGTSSEKSVRTEPAAAPAAPASPEDELRNAFNLYDKDKSGKISLGELEAVMSALGQKFSKNELLDMLKELDTNNDGQVSFEEFKALFETNAKHDDELREAFKMYDKDGSGDITKEEFAKVMESLGQKLSKKEIDAMTAELDKDGDGKINWQEFLGFHKSLNGQA